MQAMISRRFKPGVPLVRSDEYYVDCDIEYSDDERKIIEARNLFDHVLSAGSHAWPESGNSPRNLKLGSIFLVVMGVIVLIAQLVAGSFYSNGLSQSMLLFMAAIGCWICGTYADHEGIRADDQVTAGDFFHDPHLSICAESEARAQQVEAEIRSGIERLKNLISSPEVQYGRQP
jgi:hypothetical protein